MADGFTNDIRNCNCDDSDCNVCNWSKSSLNNIKEAKKMKQKVILITGAAGFIGSNLAKNILQKDSEFQVIGVDNLNDYYDVS